jgi:hypothetical protein
MFWKAATEGHLSAALAIAVGMDVFQVALRSGSGQPKSIDSARMSAKEGLNIGLALDFWPSV